MIKTKEYYVKLENGEYSIIEKAKKFTNPYDLDLFKFTDKYGTNISEGKTGMKLFTGNISPEALECRINSLGGIEKFREIINDKILEFGYCPRYK